MHYYSKLFLIYGSQAFRHDVRTRSWSSEEVHRALRASLLSLEVRGLTEEYVMRFVVLDTDHPVCR